MSTTIENRVVEMQFDNKHFETNVSTSLSTLDKLKKSLNLNGASKGLENISSAAKKFDMSPMGNAVEGVRLRFSALEVMAVTALANITNSAVNAGKRIVSALTIDPIKTGLQEYETQINAVQTILANTEHKGTTLDQVNQALDELNTYADKTIYNFTQMTRNIGTFTAAGVDLDKSVTSIKGIANLAAISGSTSQQASTAMYQLSQALAAGKVSLMDWNSVVNAGMGGQVFQNALKRTAKQLGHNVDEMIAKYGSFRESLTQGEWLTAEVLTETLSQLAGAYSKADLMQQGYSASQADEILKLAETAENAATKVKTFTQLIDTLKESLQSGWTQTWEYIVGDFDQAKELWTGVSDTLGEMINKSSESRNNLLKGALTSNWDKMIERINKAGISTEDFEERVRNIAKDKGKDLDSLIEKYGSLEKAFRSGAITSDILKEAVGRTNKTIKEADFSLVDKVLKGKDKGDAVKQVEAALESLGYVLTGKDGKYYGDDGYFGTLTEDAVRAFQQAQGLKVTGIVDEETLNALKEATSKTDEMSTNIDDIIDGVDKLGGRELLIESFKNVFGTLIDVGRLVASTFRSIFPKMTSEQLYGLIEKFKNLTDKFKLTDETSSKLRLTFKGLFAILDVVGKVISTVVGAGLKVLSKVLGVVGKALLNVTSNLGAAAIRFRAWLLDNNRLINGFKAFINIIKIVATAIKKWVKAFIELPEVQKAIGALQSAFKKFFDDTKNYFKEGGARIADFIKRLMSMDSITIDDLSGIFEDFKTNVLDYFINFDGEKLFNNIKTAISDFKKTSLEALGIAGEKFDVIKEKIFTFVDFIRSKIPAAIAILLGFMAIKGISKIGKILETFGAPLEALSESIGNVGNTITKFIKAKAFKERTEGIKNLAISIGILAASLTVLTLVDQKKLWSAVGALGVLALALVGLSIVASKVGGFADFTKTSVSLIALSGALFILAQCLKTMAKLDTKKALANSLVLIVLAGALVTIVTVMSKFAPQLSTGSLTFITLAAAIGIMVSALKKLDKLRLDNVGMSMTILAGLVTALGLLAMACNGVPLGSLVGVIALAIGVNMMINALKKIVEIDMESIKNNLGAFVAVFGSLAIVMGLAKLFGGTSFSSGVAILAIAASLTLITGVVKRLGEMDKSLIKRALSVITPLLLVLSGVMLLMSFGAGGGASIGASLALLSMSAAVVILTGAIMLLAKVDPTGLDNALVAIEKLTLCFAVILAASSLAGKATGTIIALTVGIGILAVALAGLSVLDPSGLDNATNALGKVILMFAVLVAASSLVGKGIGSLIVMTVAVGLLGALLYILSGLPVESTLGVAQSLSILLLSLAASCAILSLVNPATALTGVLGLGTFLLGLAGILAIAATLNAAVPELQTFLESGLPLIETLGNTLGSFFGGIVGGLAEGVTSSLPQIGTDLADFMTNLEPFITGAKNIDESVGTAITTLVDAVTSLAGAEFISGLTTKLFGENDMSQFATDFENLGDGLSKFATKTADVDPDQVSKATTAISNLANAANDMPNEGGWLAKIVGDNNMSTFASDLENLGDGLSKFASKTANVNGDQVSKAATAISDLANAATNIPNEGGWVGKIMGENDAATFGSKLETLGDGISKFSTKVANVNGDTVSKAASAVSSLVDVANKIPNQGGWIGKIFGDNDMTTFATNIEELGNGLAAFGTSMAGVAIETVTSGISMVGRLVGLSNRLPDGEQITLTEFGKDIKKLGGYMSDFYEDVSDIDSTTIGVAVSAANRLSTMASKIPEGGYGVLATFGTQLKSFGSQFGAFALNLSGIDTASLSMAINSLSRLIMTLSSVAGADFSSLGSFGTALGQLGMDGVSKFVEAFTNANEKVTSAGKKMVTTLTSGAESEKSGMLSAFKSMVGDAVDAVRNKYDSFKSAGKYLVEGLIKGLKDKQSEVEKAAADLAKAAKEALDSAAEIESPSKVTRKSGNFMGMGLVLGLRDYVSKSYDAGYEVAESASGGLSDAMSKVYDIITNGIDAQPTIRPVLDLSDITAGASAINGMFGMTPSVKTLAEVGAIGSMMNGNQNGSNVDVISAIKDLGKKLGNVSGDTYNINGVTYDDGSNVSSAVKSLVRAITVERRT